MTYASRTGDFGTKSLPAGYATLPGTGTYTLAGLTLLVALVGLSMLAPLITWHDPAALAPRLRLKPISADFWLGTDSLGRDLFSRVLYGGRLSITLAALVLLAVRHGHWHWRLWPSRKEPA